MAWSTGTTLPAPLVSSEVSSSLLNVKLPVVTYGCGSWPHPKGRTQIEGVWEKGAEENIWTYV